MAYASSIGRWLGCRYVAGIPSDTAPEEMFAAWRTFFERLDAAVAAAGGPALEAAGKAVDRA